MTSFIPKIERIDIVDYARLVAATAVMVFHYMCHGLWDGPTPGTIDLSGFAGIARYGYLGVELFFMISGYVIFFSSKNRTTSQFVTSRAIRLYPAFLVCLVITSLVALFWGTKAHGIYLSQFLTNLTMMPELFGRHYADGSYWTLVLELYFYTAVALLLFTGQVRQLEKYFLAWPVLILIASLIGGDRWPLLGGYFSYFSAGALFAMLRSRKSALTKALLFLCFYESLNFSALINRPADTSPATLIIIVSGFYVLFCAMQRDALLNIRLPLAKFAGGITYPLYLLHQSVGLTIIERLGTDVNRTRVVVMTMAGMFLLAFIVHVIIEKKLRNLWRAMFNRILAQPISRFESLFRPTPTAPISAFIFKD